MLVELLGDLERVLGQSFTYLFHLEMDLRLLDANLGELVVKMLESVVLLIESVTDLGQSVVHLCELVGQLCITNGHFGALSPTPHFQIVLRTAHHFQKTGANR